MLLGRSGVAIERNVFAFLIKLRARGHRQALRQGGLTVKLVRQLPSRKHHFRVRPRSPAKASIER
jgi:hypothetical protein